MDNREMTMTIKRTNSVTLTKQRPWKILRQRQCHHYHWNQLWLRFKTTIMTKNLLTLLKEWRLKFFRDCFQFKFSIWQRLNIIKLGPSQWLLYQEMGEYIQTNLLSWLREPQWHCLSLCWKLSNTISFFLRKIWKEEN